MGLDMYLEARRYVSGSRDPNGYHAVRALFPIGIDDGVDFKTAYVTITAGYWRKANAVHKWFVDNVQDGEDDCEAHEVSKDQLEALRDLLNEALDNKNAEIFPPESGFFFGSAEIDEYYWEDLTHARKVVYQALDIIRQLDEAETDYFNRPHFQYRASW
jgi:hypothetical protein